MCYNVAGLTKAAIKYAKHRGEDMATISALEKMIEELMAYTKPLYVASGYSHPQLLVFTNEFPLNPQLFFWGLLPTWAKEQSFWNQTLNARAESIFEKPTFKASAKYKRCLIYVDGFFEYHHQNKQTIPYYIQLKSHEPIILAGLWSTWLDKTTGAEWPTCTIITTHANKTMQHIHNNPKADGPRMPVILNKQNQNAWLDNQLQEKELMNLLQPAPDDMLEYYTVRQLTGKNGIGNVAEAHQKFEWHTALF